jgi:DNA-binding NtrC family response regulator/tetratricopeptide (TPR) repeat protein
VFADWDGVDPVRTILGELRPEPAPVPATDAVGDLVDALRGKPTCLIFDQASGPLYGELLPRLQGAGGLPLVVVASWKAGQEPPSAPVDRCRLTGLSPAEAASLAADFGRCESVASDLAAELHRASAGLPGPLLLLLRRSVAEGALTVNAAGVLERIAPLPAMPAAGPPVPARLERLVRCLRCAGAPAPRTVLLRVLGPGGRELLADASDRGLIAELETDGGAKVAMAWSPPSSAEDHHEDRGLVLRLAAAYRAAGDLLACASLLASVPGGQDRAYHHAVKAFRTFTATDRRAALEAAHLAWNVRTGTTVLSPREKAVAGLRLIIAAADEGDHARAAAAAEELGQQDLPPLLSLLFWAVRAHGYETRGEYDRAEEALSAAMRAAPAGGAFRSVRAELSALRGWCAFHAGNRAAAAEGFERALAGGPAPEANAAFRAWFRARSVAAAGLGLLGRTEESEEVLKQLLAVPDVSPRLRLRPVGERAIRAAQRGDREEAARAFKEVERVAAAAGNRQAQIGAVLNQAILAYKGRELEPSIQAFQTALKLSLRWGELALRSAIWCGLATVRRLQGAFKTAVRLFRQVLGTPEVRTGIRVNALVNLGEVYQLVGAGAKAIEVRRRAVQLADRLGDHYLRGLAHFGLAATEAVSGAGGETAGQRARELLEDREEWRLLGGLALYQGIGAEEAIPPATAGPDRASALRRARQHFGRGLGLAGRARDPDYRAGCLLGLVRVLLREGKTGAAGRVLERLSRGQAASIAWEYVREGRVWEHFFTAQKGGARRAVLRLAGEVPELAPCPELHALALLILAGLVQRDSTVAGAWLPYMVEAGDILDRLDALGSPGASVRVRALVNELFSDILAPRALPWRDVVPQAGPSFELYATGNGPPLLVARRGDRIRHGRLHAVRSTNRAGKDQAGAGEIRVIRLAAGAAVVRGTDAPDIGALSTVLEFLAWGRQLRDQLLARLREESRPLAAAPVTLAKTDVIGSRPDAVRAARLVARTQAEEDGRFAGTSRPLLKLFRQLPEIARSDLPVLISGESGVGKDLLARTIHRLRGAAAPFVAQHCGGLPDELVEAELFGVRRGAFTGAEADRPGLLEQAAEGTLYLDGVDAVSEEVQTALLRALEEGEVRPLGGETCLRVRFRLVGASRLTPAALRERLRDDFYYRISGFTLVVPPLRDHLEDLGAIVEELVRRWCIRTGRPRPAVAPDALARLKEHRWPGNVRELANVLERLLVAKPHEITAADIVLGDEAEAGALRVRGDRPLRAVREEVERQYLLSLLSLNRGHMQRSARIAGVSRRYLLTLLRKHGIEPREYRR